jgi:adenylate cyclase
MSNQKFGKYACYEFERKFLLSAIPSKLKSSVDYTLIEDTYFIETNFRLRTMRDPNGKIITKKLTQKYIPVGSKLTTAAITNTYLAEKDFTLFDQIKGFIIRKKRYNLQHKDCVFSVDVFDEPFENIVIAEVEFENEESMNSFVVPFDNWKEVSHEVEYTGGNLAKQVAKIKKNR